MLRTCTIARAARIIAFVAACSAPRNAAADVTIGGACPGGAVSAQATDGNNAVCISSLWQYPAYQFGSTAAVCNSTNAGIVKYTSTHAYFCNSAAWTQLYEVQSTPSITAPASSGYFVLTATTYDGNVGKVATGADAKCVTELATTSTGWQGYATASSNGQLVEGKVHAFMSGNAASGMNNLMPLTTYYFANAGDATAGGASFTTNASGQGPGDSNDWSGNSYFKGTFDYWSGRGSGTSTLWSTGGNASNRWCSTWNSSSAGATGSLAWFRFDNQQSLGFRFRSMQYATSSDLFRQSVKGNDAGQAKALAFLLS